MKYGPSVTESMHTLETETAGNIRVAAAIYAEYLIQCKTEELSGRALDLRKGAGVIVHCSSDHTSGE